MAMPHSALPQACPSIIGDVFNELFSVLLEKLSNMFVMFKEGM
jgi:hypothetical protein